MYFIYIHTYVHLTLQRAKLTLQRAFSQNGALKGQIGAAKGLVKLPSAARAAMRIEVE